MQKAQEVLEQSSSELREIYTLTKGSYAWITMCISLYNFVGHITCDKMENLIAVQHTVIHNQVRCLPSLHHYLTQWFYRLRTTTYSRQRKFLLQAKSRYAGM